MIETFNPKVRAECLYQQWFTSLEDAKNQLESWRQEYNAERPHSSLDNRMPLEYKAAWTQQQQLKKAAA